MSILEKCGGKIWAYKLLFDISAEIKGNLKTIFSAYSRLKKDIFIP